MADTKIYNDVYNTIWELFDTYELEARDIIYILSRLLWDANMEVDSRLEEEDD